MYRTARPERRAEVGGLLLSLALTSVLTGVTEPIEFSFMFLAPVLFGLHALMTGASMVIMDALGVKLGFGFSAGLFDYALNFGKATRPLLLLPVGLAYFVLYYVVFRIFILRFDLKTPGREAPEAAASKPAPAGGRVEGFIEALGGAANLVSVDACTTRLRLVVADQAAIDEAALKALGARGVIRPSDRVLQVVIGPTADLLAREIKEALGAPSRRAIKPAARGGLDPAALLRALGGATNIAALSAVSSRLRVALHDESRLDSQALGAMSLRGVARPGPGVLHLIVGPTAAGLALELKTSMA